MQGEPACNRADCARDFVIAAWRRFSRERPNGYKLFCDSTSVSPRHLSDVVFDTRSANEFRFAQTTRETSPFIGVAKIRSRRDSRERARFFRHPSSWPPYHPEAIAGYLAMHSVFFPSLYGNAEERAPASCSSRSRVVRGYKGRQNRNRNTTVISDDIEHPIVRCSRPVR